MQLSQVQQNEPIVIIQSDDSNFCNDNIKINIQLTGEPDLTGFSAVFQLQYLTYTFNDISSGYINPVLDSFRTRHLIPGRCNGFVKVYDTENRCRTSAPIQFIVKPQEVSDK